MRTRGGTAFALGVSSVLLLVSCMTPSRLTLGNRPDPWAAPAQVREERDAEHLTTWSRGYRVTWLPDLLPFPIGPFAWIPIAGRIQLPSLYHVQFQIRQYNRFERNRLWWVPK
jgi:hypothetical protein